MSSNTVSNTMGTIVSGECVIVYEKSVQIVCFKFDQICFALTKQILLTRCSMMVIVPDGSRHFRNCDTKQFGNLSCNVYIK